MPTIHLVRHAKPAATWGEAIDPGLDDIGREQAQMRAAALDKRLRTLPIFTSPLQRCRETAAPLAKLWQTQAQVSEAVAEIPSPQLSMTEKQKWLHQAMRGTWTELQHSAPPGSPDFLQWRSDLLGALREMQQDCVIFTHYIAINVAVGAARACESVVNFQPGHASVTTLEVTPNGFTVRELGEEVAGGGLMLGR